VVEKLRQDFVAGAEDVELRRTKADALLEASSDGGFSVLEEGRDFCKQYVAVAEAGVAGDDFANRTDACWTKSGRSVSKSSIGTNETSVSGGRLRASVLPGLTSTTSAKRTTVLSLATEPLPKNGSTWRVHARCSSSVIFSTRFHTTPAPTALPIPAWGNAPGASFKNISKG
jgi:hypothetical protein